MIINKYILSMGRSQDYTNKLLKQIPDAYVVHNDYANYHYRTDRILKLDKNYNFTPALNFMMYHAFYMEKAHYAVLCNNDIEIPNVGFFDQMIEEAPMYTGIITASCNSPHPGVMENDQLTEVPWVEFVAPCINRDLYIQAGNMDDSRFKRGWGVELDYCHRARDLGFKIYNDGRYRFNHIGQQTTRGTDHDKKASAEMNSGLTEKYGNDWRETLKWNSRQKNK